MSDYGHDLLFGAFITPTSADPQRPIELAQDCERSGLDLVTFQDHPYQPRHLDTWTLMSYVAARTERIKISGNVLNLPLRAPAVLARSAASLDLLSGGRVELGLGAGAFWDAIAAMGGRRLSPGESVDALAEAIDIIRGIWDVKDRSRFTVGGGFYRVDGAKRGPAPAHDIEIWLGAYQPRMLRLVAQKADGWLPSLGYVTELADPAGYLTESNATIDEAATAAGRDPAEIRRLLNVEGSSDEHSDKPLSGPPQRWAEQLAAWTLEHGFSTYVLQSDDPATLARWGEEVAPAVRELVNDGRR